MAFQRGTAFLHVLPNAALKCCLTTMWVRTITSINALLHKVVPSIINLRVYGGRSVQRCEVLTDSILAKRVKTLWCRYHK